MQPRHVVNAILMASVLQPLFIVHIDTCVIINRMQYSRVTWKSCNISHD